MDSGINLLGSMAYLIKVRKMKTLWGSCYRK